ncbi:hypothetical protein [Helicobacter pylori]|uniref:hypothetical protein n=1 Tax=Helicobacter pylori TaxID=210 RepID=UPI003571375D
MWHERFLKVFPAVMFLFSILSIFELFLIIEDMNKTEKLEREIKQDLEAIETITELLNEPLEGMDLEHFHDKKIRIK